MWEIVTKNSIISNKIEFSNTTVDYYVYQGKDKKAIFLDLLHIDSGDVNYLHFLGSCCSLVVANLFIDKKLDVEELKNLVENQRIHVLLNNNNIMRYRIGSQKFFVSQGIAALEPLSILGGTQVELTKEYLYLFDLLG